LWLVCEISEDIASERSGSRHFRPLSFDAAVQRTPSNIPHNPYRPIAGKQDPRAIFLTDSRGLSYRHMSFVGSEIDVCNFTKRITGA